MLEDQLSTIFKLNWRVLGRKNYDFSITLWVKHQYFWAQAPLDIPLGGHWQHSTHNPTKTFWDSLKPLLTWETRSEKNADPKTQLKKKFFSHLVFENSTDENYPGEIETTRNHKMVLSFTHRPFLKNLAAVQHLHYCRKINFLVNFVSSDFQFMEIQKIIQVLG